MSLMKTLARVAAGVMLAKGIGGMMQQRQQGRQSTHSTGGGILGDLFGSGSESPQRNSEHEGGLGGMLGQVLGGGAGTGRRYGGSNSQGASGGLGGMFDQLTRGSSGQRSSGGLGDILGSLGGGAAAGGLGGMLGDLLGGGQQQRDGLAQRGAQRSNDATFGELFNDAVSRQDEPEVAPTPEQNAVAGLMLKAMIQAAKSDGQIDEAERQRLLGQVGDLDDAEKQFIREQMEAPVDANALAREVPKGLEQQTYLASLMSIDFDNENEARYLNDLAQAMGISRADTNAIHEQLGVQKLYS